MFQDRTPEEAEQLLTLLGENNPDVVWMFSPDWEELKFIGSAYEDIWGRSPRKLADDPSDFLNGIHPDDHANVKEKMELLSNEESIETEYRVNAEENYQRHVWVEGVPIYDAHEEFVAVAGFARDVTDRKQYKQELEQSNERLANFASILSHDLRNPLNVASGRLQLIKKECDSEYLGDVEQSLDRMKTLIEDLLLLAQEGQSIGSLKQVNLGAATDRSWQNVETVAAELHTETEGTIQADPRRFGQLLENLIRNAVEHGGEDVSIRVGDLDDGFYVEDDGTGIPEPVREEVFEMGYTDSGGGIGLGLSIVQEIADAHGWVIRVTESADGGARFEFTSVDIGLWDS